MPAKKRAMKRHITASLPKKRRSAKLLDGRSILVNLIRDMCYRYGLAMARYEFKGKMPKPSIDEFRERIVHYINLAETSLGKEFSESVGKPLEKAREMLSTRLRLDIEKIRNGINTEVERIYDSLK